MSKLPIFEHFLSVGNLKPKLEWFFKPKLKPIFFLLNWAPDPEKPDAEGRTPIQLASDHGFDDAFQFIMMKSSHAKTLPHVSPKTSIHYSDRDDAKAGASSSISCLNPYPIATLSKRRKKNKERTTKVEDEDGVQDPKMIPCSRNQNLASDPDPAKRLRNLRKKLRDNTKTGPSSSISCLNPYPIATSSKRRKKDKERTTKVEDEDSVQDPKMIPRSRNQNLASDPDPAKRLRNLRKRLRDTEALEAKLLSGEVENPEPEQLEKVSRKGEVEDEIRTLEMSVAHLSVANHKGVVK